MRALAVASLALLAVAAAGCKKKSTGDPVAKELVAEAEKTKNTACGCKDIACAEQALADHDTWSTTNHDRMALAKIDDAQKAAAAKSLDEAGLCADKAGDPLAAEILVRLRTYRQDVCACADKKCAEDKMNEFAGWMQTNQAKLAPAKSTKRQEAESDSLSEATFKCARDLDKQSTP